MPDKRTVKAWGIFTDCGLDSVELSKEGAMLQKVAIANRTYAPEFHNIRVRRVEISWEEKP
jgi:hypothetical protein